MLVTQSTARRIIKRHFPDLDFRLTTKCQVVLKPIYDPSPAIAWQKLVPGNSIVRIGIVMPSGRIDWEAEFDL